MRKKVIFGIVVVALFIGGFLVIRSRAQSENQKKQIQTQKPKKIDIVKELEVSGKIVADRIASMRFLTGGKVTSVGAKKGDFVKKGQFIAKIDTSQTQKQLQRDLNLYSLQRLDFDQTKDDYKDVHGDKETDRLLEKNEYQLRNSVLDVEIRSLTISNNVLTAPFDGLLVSSSVEAPGEIVAATDIFEIVDPTSLYFRVEVDEADIAQVKPGQTARITLDSYPDSMLDATVSAIAYQSVETSSGTVFAVDLRGAIPPDLERYRLGMNGTARLELDRKSDVIGIPATSLIERDGKTYAEVRRADGSVEKREVSVGLISDESAEIISGLTLSDDVVLKSSTAK